MDIVLKALGVLLVVVAVLIGGVATFMVRVGSGLDAESKAYVDTTIPILVGDWNPDELTSRSSKELLALLNDKDLANLYAMFRRLGGLKQYRGAKGEAHVMLNLPKGAVTTASYLAAADFENGPAKIKLSLIKRDGGWQILEFRIDSPIYLQN